MEEDWPVLPWRDFPACPHFWRPRSPRGSRRSCAGHGGHLAAGKPRQGALAPQHPACWEQGGQGCPKDARPIAHLGWEQQGQGLLGAHLFHSSPRTPFSIFSARTQAPGPREITQSHSMEGESGAQHLWHPPSPCPHTSSLRGRLFECYMAWVRRCRRSARRSKHLLCTPKLDFHVSPVRCRAWG